MQQGVVVPGEIALGRGSGRAAGYAVARVGRCNQNPAIAGNILEDEGVGRGENQAHLAREGDSAQHVFGAVLGGCKPDFIVAGGPGQTANVLPFFGQGLLVAAEVVATEINHGDGATSVGGGGVVKKSNSVAFAGGPELADPTCPGRKNA